MNERPPIEKIAPTLLNSVGVSIKQIKGGIKFVFKNNQIINDLKQLGFSINILKVGGGELPLPELREHVDNQASLEAYWGAMAEKARYEFMIVQDEFNYWFERKYAVCFRDLQDQGIPKPIEKEVRARISLKHKKELSKKQDKLRKAEYNYRLLNNASYASIVTKGKMLQTLRNIIQGGNQKMSESGIPRIDIEDGTPKDVTSIRAVSG